MGRRKKLAFGVLASCLMILAVAVSSCSLVGQTSEQPSGVSERVEFQSYVAVDVYRPVGGEMVLVYHQESHNVITNVGLFVIARELANASTWQWTVAEGGNDKYYAVGDPRYIALSTDDTGVDATHSSWQAVDGSYSSDIEISTVGCGLERATGTYTQAVAYTPGSGTTKGSHTYSISKTFTVAAGFSFDDVQKAGLFTSAYNTNDGSSSGSAIRPLVAENTFTPVDLNAGDQIAVTWRITL